jgi:type II secretory pathway pseudopilin PulG
MTMKNFSGVDAKMRTKMKNNDGFTLVELLVATVIIIIAFVGVLLSFIRCMELSEMSKNSSLAVSAAKTRMSQINNTPFTLIKNNFDKIAFDPDGLNGKGVSYIDDSISDLLEVKITVCWQQKNGLVVGEDQNCDGIYDVGEDLNGNGELDSPLAMVTYVYDK